ncbi:Catalyzes the NADPH-dependent reduction of ketopantoate inpantoic acid [Rhizoctonia solani]|uniref:Catalyzes the NADPH-dependent reduction of ketopantoate inpantoic acid n=1 Tax=Rhizoctonia solani TaxID=456999 RepID=A0A8H7IJX9_9AGAM|nr:Catalyzes the NADPH-dependent reduction of ketopantoate inpantoic acid [Rhizoctonia solani]
MSQQDRFLVFGLGGIGAVHALALTRAGHPVSAVARSNIEITSSVFGDSQVNFEKGKSSFDVSNAQGTDVWTYVLVATKALLNSSPSLPELLEPFVTEEVTTIVMIQNGVGIEAKVELLDNIQQRRWEKVTWNCAWNSLTALTNTNTLEWLTSSSDAEALSRDVMKEVITVAQGLGLNISFDLIDTLMDRVSGKPLISSMQVDAANNRPMETEVIIGTPLRKARELGISTPILRTLYALLISKEKKYLDKRPVNSSNYETSVVDSRSMLVDGLQSRWLNPGYQPSYWINGDKALQKKHGMSEHRVRSTVVTILMEHACTYDYYPPRNWPTLRVPSANSFSTTNRSAYWMLSALKARYAIVSLTNRR